MTESELARRLGFSRAALRDWRERYLDAPGLDSEPQAWREFIHRNGLGVAPNREAPPDNRREILDGLLSLETGLRAVRLKIAAALPAEDEPMRAVQETVAEALKPAYEIAGRL